MEFNLAEKLAIVKAIDEVILADGHVKRSEIDFLEQLMMILEFDVDLLDEAREITAIEAVEIIKAMTGEKKNAMSIMLREMACSDGEFNEDEFELVMNLLIEAGVDLDY